MKRREAKFVHASPRLSPEQIKATPRLREERLRRTGKGVREKAGRPYSRVVESGDGGRRR